MQTTKDPTVIEQTNRQIRSIEKLSKEVHMSMKSQKSNQQQSYLQLMSATESACENRERLSIDSNDASRPSIVSKK